MVAALVAALDAVRPQLWPAARLAPASRPRSWRIARQQRAAGRRRGARMGHRATSTSPSSACSSSPTIVGIYYVAQQVASLPQKLKTSFDPILGPVITQKPRRRRQQAVAKQVRQVGFWIIAAQAGIALVAGDPGRGGDGAGRPAISSPAPRRSPSCSRPRSSRRPAAVSEAALVYIARHAQPGDLDRDAGGPGGAELRSSSSRCAILVGWPTRPIRRRARRSR